MTYFDRKYVSEAFFDENFGENVHYFRFSNVIVYFSSSYFLFFSLNHISLLLITSPSTWYRWIEFFFGVKGHCLSWRISHYSFNFWSFYLARRCRVIRSSMIFPTLSKCLSVFYWLLETLVLSITLSPIEFFWKYISWGSLG